MNKHLLHKNSKEMVLGNPKLPLISDIEYGEIAINYGFDGETLSIKNTKNEIVTFSSDKKGGGGVSGDYVAKSGDTMSGGLIINSTLSNGETTIAIGHYSHAEGRQTKASGEYSHAEGNYTQTNGYYSHAEGQGTTASGDYSHAEGFGTQASGYSSHAEGRQTTAMGEYSHAEGGYTTANGDFSHAEGRYTIANNYVEHASGIFNTSTKGVSQKVEDLLLDSTATLFSIGNGIDVETRKNAFEVKWNGDTYFSGDTKFAKGITANTISAVTIDVINHNVDTIDMKLITLSTKFEELLVSLASLTERVAKLETP